MTPPKDALADRDDGLREIAMEIARKTYKKGPMCRDCADEMVAQRVGPKEVICPIRNEPCDPEVGLANRIEQALRDTADAARREATERAAEIADRRAAACLAADALEKDPTERCAGIEAAHIATLIRAKLAEARKG